MLRQYIPKVRASNLLRTTTHLLLPRARAAVVEIQSRQVQVNGYTRFLILFDIYMLTITLAFADKGEDVGLRWGVRSAMGSGWCVDTSINDLVLLDALSAKTNFRRSQATPWGPQASRAAGSPSQAQPREMKSFCLTFSAHKACELLCLVVARARAQRKKHHECCVNTHSAKGIFKQS